LTLGDPTRFWLRNARKCDGSNSSRSSAIAHDEVTGRGSIIAIVATDAPMLPHQLERIAKRVGMGLGKLGSLAGNSSGDLFLAFSTANRSTADDKSERAMAMIPNEAMNDNFQATIEATEEAVMNAMLAADTMEGADGVMARGLPADRLVKRCGNMVACLQPHRNHEVGPQHSRTFLGVFELERNPIFH
jgi:L-aminopeptidase/D-esterase-like protein